MSIKVTITEGSEAKRLFLEPGPRTNCRLVVDLDEQEQLEAQLMSHYVPGPPAPEGMTRAEQLVWLREQQMRQLFGIADPESAHPC